MFGFVAGCHHLFPVPNLMARMLLHLSGISTYIYQVFAIIFCSTSDLQHSFDVSSLPQWVGLEELKLQKVAAEFRLGGQNFQVSCCKLKLRACGNTSEGLLLAPCSWRERSCNFRKCLLEEGWELWCSFPSPAKSTPEEVNYARDSTGSIKFLSPVSVADLSFTAPEVSLFCWGLEERSQCKRTVSFQRSPSEPQRDVGLPIKLVFH